MTAWARDLCAGIHRNRLVGNKLSEVTIDASGDNAPNASQRSGGSRRAHNARSGRGEQRLAVGDNTGGAHAADGCQHEPMRFGGSRREDGGRQPSLSEGEERAIVTDNDERSRGCRKLRPPPIHNRAVDEPSHVAPSEVRRGGEPPELGVGDEGPGEDGGYDVGVSSTLAQTDTWRQSRHCQL